MRVISKKQVNFYLVSDLDDGQRLDNLLIKILKGVPKSHIYRIIRAGEVRVNKKRVDAFYKVKCDDQIRIPPVSISQKEDCRPSKNFIPIPVIYEDEYFLIIDKPSGMASHGGSGISYGIIEQLRIQYPQHKFLELVHRLDKETSGILIIAKKRQALVKLQEIIKQNQMQKYYYALTSGSWVDDRRNVKLSLYKYLTQEGERRVKVSQENGKFSNTVFSVVTRFNNYTLVEAELKTGRTHQIRVHLQYLNHPIVGDDKYGDFELNKQLFKSGLKRMFLHAHKVSFKHPITNKELTLSSEIPFELKSFMGTLN